MQSWAGNPTGGDIGIAIGAVVLLIAAVVAVQISRGAGPLNLLQVIGVMVAVALLIVLILKGLTSARSRRSQ